jgi:pimeloyl-ACP methyl ester carboxylesterase
MHSQELVELHLPSGEALRGDLHYSDSCGQHAIIFCHGFGSVRTGEKSIVLQEECARREWTFAAFDFRGHGESGGSMRDLRPSRLLEDLSAIRDFLAARGVKRLGLVGSSMGGFAAAWFALQAEEVKACVLIAPAFRFLERRWEMLSEFERTFWKSAGHVRYKTEDLDVEVGYCLMEERELFPSTELAKRWTKPALIFHGLADDTVPPSDSIEFQQQAPGTAIELRLFKDGDHRLNAIKEEMAAESCRFFTRYLL